MKKKIFLIALAFFSVLTIVLLSGCNSTSSKSDKLVIYTSFYPIYDFTQRVGGDNVEVVNLVKPGMEAHGFELTAKQIVKLSKSDLIVINGVGMESWVSKLSAETQSKILDTSKSVDLIERTSNKSNNEQDYDEHHNHDHHGAYDPHIWLSVKNAIKQMEMIKYKLMSLDAKNTTSYENNFQASKLMFENLENSYASLLSSENLATNTFIVSHRAFGYLANDYNLIQYSISGIETDIEPLPSVMSEIIDFIIENNVKAIFYQSFVSTKVAEEISKSTGAKLYKLSTLEGLTQKEIARGENYTTIMYQNLITLKNALAKTN